MKKMIMLLLLTMAFGSQALYAAEKDDSKQSFWDKLRAKIESITPQKKTAATTATGGVRGAQVSTEDLYWKDEASGQLIADEEIQAFTQAMELAGQEDKAKAQTAFADFVKKYPDSYLRKDAEQAMALLGEAGTQAK